MDHAQKWTMIDLFAGCGGLSLGLEQANFSPVCFSEISPEAAATYKHNRPHITWENGGNYFPDARSMVKGGRSRSAISKLLTKLNLKSGKLGLVCGGPPCQGFSRIGHRRIHATDRENIPTNHLYISMSEVVKLARPKLFLFENVQGLLTARWKDRSSNEGEKGEVFSHVLETFYSLNEYVIRYRVVRAFNYGVPQNRPRVFVVGIRKDIFDKLATKKIVNPRLGPLSKKHNKNREFPLDPLEAFKGEAGDGFFPENLGLEKVPSIEEVLSDLVDTRSYEKIIQDAGNDKSKLRTTRYSKKPASYFQDEMRSPPPEEVQERLAGQWSPNKVRNHEYSRHSEQTRGRFREIQKVGRAEGNNKNKKFSQRALPKKWVNGKPNITVCSMPDDYVHYHKTQNRSLTVREWARLQTFPDWYFFCGKRTTGGTRRAGRPQDGIFDREVPQYTQIGNAVPVRLAKAIGEHFHTLLEATL